MAANGSSYLILGHILARMDINNPTRKSIDQLFQRLSLFATLLVGALSGLLAPVVACVPFLFFLGIGFIYTLLMEMLLPGATGFANESFLIAFNKNVVLFTQLLITVLKYTVIPSLLVGSLEITLRHIFYKQKTQQGYIAWLYKNSVILAAPFTLATIILFWNVKDAIFGVLGLLFIAVLAGWFARRVYKSILLTAMDLVLVIILFLSSAYRRLFFRIQII